MVNYPHQISRKIAQVRPKKSNRVDFANRGMSFESAINATNDSVSYTHLTLPTT